MTWTADAVYMFEDKKGSTQEYFICCNLLTIHFLTVQNKVIQSETPQGTVQQHTHTIFDIINPLV